MAELGKPFSCPICLELAYKPVVQGCGHMFCFWCVHRSMSTNAVSHCPVCQKPYVHLPRIAAQLHHLLQAVHPREYAARATEVAAEERDQNLYSPAIDSVTSSSSSSRNPNPKSVLACKVCKKLLFKPVALNCGHLMCRSCAAAGPSNACVLCGVHHPGPFPSVCIDLSQYMEKELGSEYARRSKEVGKRSSSLATWRSGHVDDVSALNSQIHPSVGCDACGMMPILGRRFHCLDCPESCGYDLCQNCHERGNVAPGRFNQRHTPRHRMEERSLRSPWIFVWAW
jgi:hypothetical protein